MNYEIIKTWCKENKTSIAALEKRCGLGNTTVRAWENSTPRVDTLLKVSKETGIPIEKLITKEKGE